MHAKARACSRRRQLGGCLGFLSAVCWSALAAENPPLPPGLPVGPWILAPSFSQEVQFESNLFRTNDSTAEVDSERILLSTAGIGAQLPFRNSLLRMTLAGTQRDFRAQTFDLKTAVDAGVELQLNFSGGDRLVLRDLFRNDYARVDGAIGDELFFRGEPYRQNRWEAELSRTIAGRQGYLARVRREDFNSSGTTDVGFFDFRGFDTVFEYRHPLPSSRWATVHHSARSYNYYRPTEVVPGTSERLVGVPFRKEQQQSLQFGIQGLLADNKAFFARLGYVRFDIDLPISGRGASYRGLGAAANWSFRPARRTTVDVQFERAPLPSALFDTYYVSDELRASAERGFLRRGRANLITSIGRSKYGSPSEQLPLACRSFRLEERRQLVEASAAWLLHERIALRAGATHELRRSNCALNEFDATSYRAGIVVGWF